MEARVLRNRGRLVSCEDMSEYEVVFEFHVSGGSKFEAQPSRRSTLWGEVCTADERPLPEGRYSLHVSSGETLIVENTGLTGWRVVPENPAPGQAP